MTEFSFCHPMNCLFKIKVDLRHFSHVLAQPTSLLLDPDLNDLAVVYLVILKVSWGSIRFAKNRHE